MNQLLNLKKPGLDEQIKFVRLMQNETVRVIKTSDMMGMLKAIEENLIAVKLWNQANEKGANVDRDPIIILGQKISELVDALEESKKLIKTFHCLGMDEATTETAWLIYEANAPEMVKLNNLIKKFRRELAAEALPQKALEPPATNGLTGVPAEYAEGEEVLVCLLHGEKEKKVWHNAVIESFSPGEPHESMERVNLVLTDSKVTLYGVHQLALKKKGTEVSNG